VSESVYIYELLCCYTILFLNHITLFVCRDRLVATCLVAVSPKHTSPSTLPH
jgi:hypothetical protein